MLIMRHGETDWNIQSRMQGTTDIELNANGIKQATIAAEELKNREIDIIISSPLKRAKKTAEIVSNIIKVPYVCDNSLVERGFGDYEGTDPKKADYELFWNYNSNYSEKHVEPIKDFYERVDSGLKKIEENYIGKNILLVTHGGTSRGIFCHFYGIPKDGDMLHCFHIKNCEVKELNFGK